MGRVGHGPTSSSRSLSAGAVASLPRPECTRTWLYSCYIQYMHVPCAHAPGTGRSHERIFSLCDGVHDVSTAEPFWKTCCQKSGSIPFSIQPLWEVCKCLRCLQSRSASKGGQAQSKRCVERRGMEKTRKKWRWCCRLMLLLRRRTRDSLGAVSSWINEVLRKDDIDYCQKMCDKPFGERGEGGGKTYLKCVTFRKKTANLWDAPLGA